MAQAFVTQYNNAYRWHDIDRRKSLKPVDKLAEQLPDGDIWLIPKKIGEDDEEGKENLVAAEAAIRKMYRKRLWTTYQVSYSSDMMPKQEEKEEGESFDSALLSYCKTLYEPKKQMIPPPLPTARRLYGYIRPTNMYVPLSMYQNDYGTVAYHILDSNSRLRTQPDGDGKVKEGNKEVVNVNQKQSNEEDVPSKPKQTGKSKSQTGENKATKKIKRADCNCPLKRY